MSENAPLQDRFRERCGRSAVKIMRIEISFRRDGQAGNIIKKRHQLSDDVLELRGQIVSLRGFRKVFAADRGILPWALLLLMPGMMIVTTFV